MHAAIEATSYLCAESLCSVGRKSDAARITFCVDVLIRAGPQHLSSHNARALTQWTCRRKLISRHEQWGARRTPECQQNPKMPGTEFNLNCTRILCALAKPNVFCSAAAAAARKLNTFCAARIFSYFCCELIYATLQLSHPLECVLYFFISAESVLSRAIKSHCTVKYEIVK